jgi:prepilin-type N-terminal cleavage/methylation domain-containing protein
MQMKKTGFTLIELLVVIAIIAILMAILMPSLNAARDQARRVHCVSNTKTLALGWLMYKDANDDKLVPGSAGHTPTMQWVDTPSSNTAPLSEKQAAITRGLLYTYVGKSVGVYHCPADSRRETGSTAYVTFSLVGGVNGEAWKGEYNIAMKYGELKGPSRLYIFVEEMDTRGYNEGSWQLAVKSKTWVDPFAMFHKRRTTLGFADGHGEMHEWQDKYAIDWALGALYTPNSFTFSCTPPAGVYTDINYMSEGYARKP